MSESRILVLGLGNDLAGDDAVGLVLARELEDRPDRPDAEFVLTPEAGLALLEIMTGYDRVLILDSIQTGRHPVGWLHTLGPDCFSEVIAPSAHYAGLPEILALGRSIEVPMPTALLVLAVETEIPQRFEEGLSLAVRNSIPAAINHAVNVMRTWQTPSATTAATA